MKPNRVATAVLAILFVGMLVPAMFSARNHPIAAKTHAGSLYATQDPKPQGPTTSSETDLEAQADLQMARKEYPEAARTYKLLVQKAPSNAVYLNKLGIAYHQEQMLGAAQHFYEKASKTDPHYADAFNNIGTIYYQKKKYS